MGANSKIEWCHHTMNPFRGCARVHTGCLNCYAERMSKRNPGVLGVWGVNGTRVVAAEKTWGEPLKWNKAAAKAGERHRVFCASLADVFENWQGPMVNADGLPLMKWHMAMDKNRWFDAGDETHQYKPEQCVNITMDDCRKRLFDLIDATPNLDWQLLTKRPENIAKMWPGGFRKNVWLLTSVSDQQTADAMIPPLLQCRNLAPVLGLSMEPLVGPVDLSPWIDRLDWAIVGGESGSPPRVRTMHPQWVQSIRDQCQAAGVPFFFKQWGEFLPASQAVQIGGFPVAETDWMYNLGDDDDAARVGKKIAGRLLDGRTWDEFPKVSVTNG